MVLVATQVKRRRGTTAENDAFTGAEGEIVVDTERHELRVHDGATQGGFKIGGDKANVALDNLTSVGTEIIAHNAMPSSRYINLTVGASGTSYQAPADGYFRVSGAASAAGQRLNIDCNQIGYQGFSYASGNEVKFSCPVRKGGSLYLAYNMPQANVVVRFVYAVGAAG